MTYQGGLDFLIMLHPPEGFDNPTVVTFVENFVAETKTSLANRKHL